MMCAFMICALKCTVMRVVIICVLSVLFCIVLQLDVDCVKMFSAVLYRVSSAMWHCTVRLAEMSHGE